MGEPGMRLRGRKLWQTGSCLLCVIAERSYSVGLAGTEFSGGRITGPILDSYDVGIVLFVLAALLTFVYPRVAAAAGIGAALMCFPLYFYFTAPGPFRRIFPGEYSVPTHTNFVWDGRAMFGIVTLAVVTSICVSNLSSFRREAPAGS
jgi:hypothetical protein